MYAKSNLHTHTLYSDGKSTPEDMVNAAMERGFVSLGFSEHAPAPYDINCAIKTDKICEYYLEIVRLKKKYEDRIEIYLGAEIDMLNPFKDKRLDYIIGSVHYLANSEDDGKYCVDYDDKRFHEAVLNVGGGDIRLLVQTYYEMIGDMAENFSPDIIGHFDVIAKLNNANRLFNENSKWYEDAAFAAIERISKTDCIVEVNTGGIKSGYRTEPYPAKKLLRVMREMSIPVIISSDAHNAENLDFWFNEAVSLLLDAGYRSAKRLQGGIFIDVEII